MNWQRILDIIDDEQKSLGQPCSRRKTMMVGKKKKKKKVKLMEPKSRRVVSRDRWGRWEGRKGREVGQRIQHTLHL